MTICKDAVDARRPAPTKRPLILVIYYFYASAQCRASVVPPARPTLLLRFVGQSRSGPVARGAYGPRTSWTHARREPAAAGTQLTIVITTRAQIDKTKMVRRRTVWPSGRSGRRRERVVYRKLYIHLYISFCYRKKRVSL